MDSFHIFFLLPFNLNEFHNFKVTDITVAVLIICTNYAWTKDQKSEAVNSNTLIVFAQISLLLYTAFGTKLVS